MSNALKSLGVSASLSNNGTKISLADEKLSIVPATQVHRNYIIATWSKSIPMCFHGTARDTARWSEPKLAEMLWDSADVLTTNGDSIHGWSCFTDVGEQRSLMAAYVVPELRGCGVLRCMATRARLHQGTKLIRHRFERLTLDGYKYDADTVLRFLIDNHPK